MNGSGGLSAGVFQEPRPGATRLSPEQIKQLGDKFYRPEKGESSNTQNRILMARVEPVTSPLVAPAAASSSVKLSPSASPNNLALEFALTPLNKAAPVSPAMVMVQSPPQIAGLAVFVGYADNLRANPNFPVPWQGSPNTVFIGQGPEFDSGAIRIDNNTSSPIHIDDVFVTVPGWTVSAVRDAQGNGVADLWGSFTIPPNSTVILAQTAGENFDTSDFGVRGCGDTLANGQSPIPTVKITINGAATTFSDTGHVLDTGGFDLACRGNESLQWRLIGTAGIESQTSKVTLAPPTSVQPVGATYTATAQVLDASNQPTPNVIVDFIVLSGPNAGKTGKGTTDSQGNARFSYSSVSLGTDILRASVTNAAGGVIQSEQVTTTWTSADPCPAPTGPPDPTHTVIVNAGPSTGEFSDPLILAAQLTDGNGAPLANRLLTFNFGAQTFQSTTDNNGVATINIPAAPTPGSVPLNVAFAGETGFNPAQLSTSINIDREETAIRYTGGRLLGTVVPQAVSALLIDPVGGAPIANETVTFRVGTIQAQAVTNARGIAATTLTLGADQTTGPMAIQVSFAGDNLYKPSLGGAPVTVYLSTSFVVWGGNQGGVRLGQDVNFWGAQWQSQIISGNFAANPSFKGFADPVNQVHVCEAGAGSGGPLDDHCWTSKPGNSFPPPLTVPAYIEVIISNAIAKQGSEIFGNIAAAAVCKVDPTPVYGPDPGKPGFCTLVDVVEDGAGLFPQPPALTATQTQPATVLPGQSFNVTAQITNSSTSQASNVTVNESFDGLTPATGTQTFVSILNGAQQTATFQVTSPAISLRQSNETSLAYQQRLAAADGSVFTSTGTISFTDVFGQQFLPITVSSASRLQVPELTVGITGPPCVGPGSKIAYKVTVGNIGTATAQNVLVTLSFPDGSNAGATIASIPAGGSVTTTINFVVPAISSKQPGESDQQYLARLATIDGSTLVTTAKVDWQDALGNSYGEIEQKIISTIERVPILTVTPQGPATLLPGQQATLNFTVHNTGGGNTSQVLLQVTNPDGSIVNIPAFSLQGGQANTVTTTFTLPGAAKRAGETDAAYQARLAALDNSTLKFTTQLRWFDASSNPYGPTSGSSQIVEVLPLVTVSLTGPATTFSTNNINYNLRIANTGHADASGFTVQVHLPDGSTLNPFPASPLVAGSAAQISIPFGIPRTQPTGQMSAAATLNWTDAAANAYGPQSATVLTANTHLDFPVVSAGPDQSITTNTTTLNGSVTDNQLPPGGVLLSTWKQISGPAPATFANTSSPVTQITFSANGTYVVQLVATVANTTLPLTASANATITVNAPTSSGGGGGGGTVITSVTQGAIGQPLAGTVVQGQVPITVADGTTLVSGVLDFWPTSNPSNVHVLNPNVSGTGTIGTFDGTTLQNGEYIVRLTATDSAGNTQISLIDLNVIGDNKPGRLTKTVTDLRVPVAGLRITINRIYDSLERGVVGDFGFGWKLGTSVEVSTDSSHNVTFTFNGHRETFFFKPLPQPFPFSFLLTPNYVPQPGVFGTLTSDGCSLLIVQGGFTCFLAGAYQPTTYTYTDPYGRIYIFGADGSMKSITDLNGNVLTFTAAGISSAGGVSIAFVRDAQGRITQITDLNGNSRNYTYNAAGDLVAVAIPGIPSPVTYTYNADHFLLQQTDPRGNSTSATYFPDGRLQSSTDPLGNVTQYSYDIVNNTVTTAYPDGGVMVQINNSFGNPLSITDPLNRTTTFSYDANQNLLTLTNPLGKTTTFTYDANGNQTSMTDPLGHTTTKSYNRIGRLLQVTDALGLAQKVNYDTAGNPVSFSDSIGIMAQQTVDNRGNVTSQTLANGSTTQSVYDNFGNPISIIDSAGFTSARQYDSMGNWTGLTDSIHGTRIAFQYDPLGNMTQQQDPLGRTMSYVYDGDGNRINETNQNGGHFIREYDAANNEIKTTYPDGTTTSRTYDFAGRVVTSANQAGQVTRFAYDKAGQLTKAVIGDGTPSAITISYDYDPAGRLIATTDGRGNTTSLTHDDADRVVAVTDALGATTGLSYDADGRITAITSPTGAKKQMTYDARGRPTVIVNPDGSKVQNSFNGMFLASTTDEAGKTTSYSFNGAGDIASVTNSAGNSTQYLRDASGRLISVIDANGHSTNYEYDAADHVTKKTFPDGSFEQFTYDDNDNVTAIRLTDGHVNHYQYDSMNQLSTISYFDGQIVSFTYTPTGKRKTATAANGTTGYLYDSLDRLAQVTQPDGQTISYAYDAANNITSITTPFGVTTYNYDAANRLASLTDPLGNITQYVYDLEGRLVQRILPNGIVSTQTFDALDRLVKLTHQRGTDAPFESFVYTYDPSGHRTSALEADGTTTTWAYDDAYRLVRERVTGASGIIISDTSYAYDPAGNRSSMTVNGRTTNYQYNLLDQLVQAGTAHYTYDARGNLVQVADTSGTTSYSYDAANRLSSVSLPGAPNAASYSYQADGLLARRIAGGNSKNFIWNELTPYGDVLYETDGSGAALASYTTGPRGDLLQQIGNGSAPASYYLHDGVGNIIGLSNLAGVETDRYRFDAFGNVTLFTGASMNPFRYRGQRTDDVSGLQYMRARSFSSETGRFLTRDVAPFVLSDPVDLNRYTYAAADPINGYDPTGFADAAEYGGITRETSEDATIEGYVVSRIVETLLFCAVDALLAMEAKDLLQSLTFKRKDGTLGSKEQFVTVAFGHAVYSPTGIGLDVKYGFDRFLLARSENEKIKERLVAKAQEYRSSLRKEIVGVSTKYPPAILRDFLSDLGDLALPDKTRKQLSNADSEADRKGNHAERQVIKKSGAPYQSILESVFASRTVCLTCEAALKTARVSCFGPLGTHWDTPVFITFY